MLSSSCTPRKDTRPFRTFSAVKPRHIHRILRRGKRGAYASSSLAKSSVVPDSRMTEAMVSILLSTPSWPTICAPRIRESGSKAASESEDTRRDNSLRAWISAVSVWYDNPGLYFPRPTVPFSFKPTAAAVRSKHWAALVPRLPS